LARKSLKPEATSFEVLDCVQKKCPSCGQAMWNEYNNPRHIRTLKGVVELPDFSQTQKKPEHKTDKMYT
jgi:hypothetical protein